jgi:hypothetical protein
MCNAGSITTDCSDILIVQYSRRHRQKAMGWVRFSLALALILHLKVGGLGGQVYWE